jgi:STE24 endopeptidase
MAFDPNAATARYIDSLGPAALEKAHQYTIGGHWILFWGLHTAMEWKAAHPEPPAK